MRAYLFLWSAFAAASAFAGPSLKQAAVLYHQGRYDSALTVLEECRSGPLKRRDSLALFQYAGMTSARLGHIDQAKEDFRALLGLDSLFQFPRNEDSAILAAFAQAREERAQAALAGSPSAPAASGALPATRDSVAEARGGTPTQADPRVPVPVAQPVPAGADRMTASPEGDRQNGSPTSFPAPSGPGSPNPEPRAPVLPGPAKASGPQAIGLAMGAIPLGGGWLARGRSKQGWTLALLQAGGLAFSVYASSRMSAIQNDADGIRAGELGAEQRWQWTQRVTLSIAVGAYLFSLIASRGE
jgi:tetratricopeptide (TPR) repeat protein